MRHRYLSLLQAINPFMSLYSLFNSVLEAKLMEMKQLMAKPILLCLYMHFLKQISLICYLCKNWLWPLLHLVPRSVCKYDEWIIYLGCKAPKLTHYVLKVACVPLCTIILCLPFNVPNLPFNYVNLGLHFPGELRMGAPTKKSFKEYTGTTSSASHTSQNKVEKKLFLLLTGKNIFLHYFWERIKNMLGFWVS